MKTNPLAPKLLQQIDAYWRAANYLSVGQIYLYDNPLLKKPLTLAHVKPRLLGHWGTTPGLNFVYAHLNRVIKAQRSERDLRRRPRPRRSGDRRQHLSGGHLQRGLPARLAGRRGDEAAVHAVLLSRRHSESCRAGDAGLDSRGGRARLLAVARLRRGIRQSRPARCVCRRRRRSRNRPARDQLALEQVPQSGPRRRRAADSASERVQDRRTDGAGADPPRRTRRALPRLRLQAVCRRGG